MMVYRIFTNDRGPNLYSCLCSIRGNISPKRAIEMAKNQNPTLRQPWGEETYKAIAWPPDAAGKRWLSTFVDRGI